MYRIFMFLSSAVNNPVGDALKPECSNALPLTAFGLSPMQKVPVRQRFETAGKVVSKLRISAYFILIYFDFAPPPTTASHDKAIAKHKR